MKDYEKWFKKAENDLLAIKILLKNKDAPVDVCCFHAQQAAEKYIKAYLVVKSINFPKTHDLELLVMLASKVNPAFLEIHKVALLLLNYGIVPRYPDEADELTIEDAIAANKNAIIMKDFILQHFFE
jgi:HEPN domain-containing protein